MLRHGNLTSRIQCAYELTKSVEMISEDSKLTVLEKLI